MNQIDLCAVPDMMDVEFAIKTMLTTVKTQRKAETLPLQQAYGRVLASSVRAPMNVPPLANSAMDGYAFAADIPSPKILKLVGKSLAGHPYAAKVAAGECVRITTGALIPDGCDTVMMQEQTAQNTDENGQTWVELHADIIRADNVRLAGEDITEGSQLFAAGHSLGAADLALLASLGISKVDVNTKLTVALMVTGDELVEPGNPLQPGQIYESNRFALRAMLEELQVQVIDLGIIQDDLPTLRAAFTQALDTADLILSCGGVSVGEADLVKQVLAELGNIGFWRVAIKPGKPFAFGLLSGPKDQYVYFCGLPGNPVSSYVTFQQLVLPLLSRLQGKPEPAPLLLNATTTNDIRKRPGRADFQRGIYQQTDDGSLVVTLLPKQGSGVMSSISQANCYVRLSRQSGNIPAGEIVQIEPFFSLPG